MIQDLERIVSDYLRELPAVATLSTRIVGKTPTRDTRGTRDSWVRVTQLAAPDVTGGAPDHLIAYVLQFDCYAGDDEGGGPHGQPEATQLGRTVRVALREMEATTQDGVVVTEVRITGHLRSPDPEFQPARERVIVTAEIRAHA